MKVRNRKTGKIALTLAVLAALGLSCPGAARAAQTESPPNETAAVAAVTVLAGEECEHDYVAGRCSLCGDVQEDYAWYYSYAGEEELSVGTAGEMAALADIVNAGADDFNGRVITLTADVDLSQTGNWEPVGGYTKSILLSISSQQDLDEALESHAIIYDSAGASYMKGSSKNAEYSGDVYYFYVEGGFFAGTFDGGGHTISGMYIDTDQSYCGLFGQVSGTLCDFTVSGVITNTAATAAADYVGGACGMLAVGGTVSDVTTKVNITASGCYNVGGVMGFAGEIGVSSYSDETSAVVERCINYGSVKGYARVGGIAGRNAGTIRQCANFGTVYNAAGAKNGTGGITGMNGNNNTASDGGLVQNCYNAGYVNSNGGYWSGGIVGFQNSLSRTENCYNYGSLKVVSWTNPGIGQNEGMAVNVYAVDTVTGSDPYGMVGSTSGGTSENCVYLSQSEMQGEDFVNTLNAASDEVVWAADSAGRNNGYPVFTWQPTEASNAVSVWTSEGVALYSTVEEAFQAAGEAEGTSEITLLEDCVTKKTLTVASGTETTLDLSGYSLGVASGSSGFSIITVNGTFTLKDSSGGNGMLTGSSTDGRTVYGGAVYVKGTFYMKSGRIYENSATYGGGVYVYNNGAFSMEGGTISSNSATTGGGVYVNSNGTFSMNGGTISGNAASSMGGRRV